MFVDFSEFIICFVISDLKLKQFTLLSMTHWRFDFHPMHASLSTKSWRRITIFEKWFLYPQCVQKWTSNVCTQRLNADLSYDAISVRWPSVFHVSYIRPAVRTCQWRRIVSEDLIWTRSISHSMQVQVSRCYWISCESVKHERCLVVFGRSWGNISPVGPVSRITQTYSDRTR